MARTLLGDWGSLAALNMRMSLPNSSRVVDAVRWHAERTPRAIAIVAPARAPLSYERLWSQLVQVSGTLQCHELMPGDRVALIGPDGPETAVAFLALSAVAPTCPLNPACQEREFDAYFSDLNVGLLVTSRSDRAPAVLAARQRGIPVVRMNCPTDVPAGCFSLTDRFPSASPHEAVRRDTDVALVLTTSGTTSRAKVVALTHAHLMCSALNVARSLGLEPADRCLDVMPLFHVHGLIGGLLSSLVAGASVICPPGFDAPRFFSWIDELAPTWYTAVPSMHQSILARAGSHRDVIARRPLRFVRSASAALPAAVRDGLEAAFDAPVIEAYGMTEASHQIASNPLPPGVRKGGSVGLPTGTEAAIVDAAGNTLAPGAEGEIVVRGPSVIGAYDGNPPGSESAFLGDWLRTGDVGYIDGDGYLFITGRLKEAINRGGETINPREIDDVLVEHPAVAQAATFGIPHDTLGQQVAAAVVLGPDAFCSDYDLREFVAARLAAFKVPARILVLDQIPKGPTGKVQRNRLAEQLGLRQAERAVPATRPPLVAPRTDIEKSLAAIWRTVLDKDATGLQDNFLDLGGDSLLAGRALARICLEFDLELSLVALFERPTLEGMAAVVEAALESRGSSGRAKPGDGAVHDPNCASDGPLSFGQERLWFVEQWRPGTGLFNVRIPLRLRGRLNVWTLEQSLAVIVRRHDALRASFPDHDGSPVQRIAPDLKVELRQIDVSGRSMDEQTADVDRLMADEMRRPFDLARGPLLRASLLRLGADDHVLLLTVHHIVVDRWSQAILLREFGAAYTHIDRGEPLALPPVSLQYSDYARDETRRLDVVARNLAYWTDQLKGHLPLLELPTDYPRPPVADLRGGQQAIRLSRELTAKLELLSRQLGVTPFMTFLSAFKVLMSQHTGIDDVIVAAPVAGRSDVATEGTIGFFVQTLMLRTDVSGNLSFRDLVARVQAVTLNALQHQHVPFQQLVDALHVKRSAHRNPIADIAFNFLNTPALTLDVPGLATEHFEPAEKLAEFSLTMRMEKLDDRFHVALIYQRALFSDHRMAALLDEFRSLLEQVTANPARQIRSGVHGNGGILIDRNDTAVAFAEHECLHTLIEDQALRTPPAVAVISGADEIRYDSLNARANQLAQLLRRRGVERGGVVGPCAEPSVNMVVAILAILKAGGVYLPLDPGYPADRCRFMIDDAGARVIVTETAWATRLRSRATSIVCLDSDQAAISAEGAGNLEVPVRDDDLAYIMYTSGSTGRPKGVMVAHRAVRNLMRWAARALAVSGTDRVLLRTSSNFDPSLMEIFVPLMSGAFLVVAPRDSRFDAAGLVNLIQRQRISILQVVPSLLRLLLDEPDFSRCDSLRSVVSGGETLPWELQERFFERSHATLCNLYGPTETCIWATAWTCRPGTGDRIVPIGRPITNMQAYVLDNERQPVPAGMPGQLFLGGAGLARGYINRPDLTAERFVPHPFSADREARLYATGDQVRYRDDGALEFLGRVDDQVKIRGVRVEFQEVETILRRHPAIRDAVVAAWEDPRGDLRLAGYYVSGIEPAPTDQDLRRFLLQTLPDAMVPSLFIRIDTVPLSPAGKVDRRALPAPAVVRPDLRETFVAPRTPLEQAIARIWAEVLKVERIGVDDDFFDLGGHSLLATQLTSRMSRLLAHAVPIAALFETPTIAGLIQTMGISAHGAVPANPATSRELD